MGDETSVCDRIVTSLSTFRLEYSVLAERAIDILSGPPGLAEHGRPHLPPHPPPVRGEHEDVSTRVACKESVTVLPIPGKARRNAITTRGTANLTGWATIDGRCSEKRNLLRVRKTLSHNDVNYTKESPSCNPQSEPPGITNANILFMETA